MERPILAVLAGLFMALPGLSVGDFAVGEELGAEVRAGVIPLYDTTPPGSRSNPNPELWFTDSAGGLAVRNVSLPTLKPVLPPQTRASGAAVIVIPGGAFVSLSMANEGLDVANALAEHGIAAFVLKYRTEPTPPDQAGFAAVVKAGLIGFLKSEGTGSIAGEETALLDAQAALRFVTARAKEWRIDPNRIGLLGFSAGAITVRNVILADAPGARADFAGLIYGQMVARTPPPDAPPIFVAFAADDPLFGKQGFGLVEAWRKAGKPVELHYYETGDHGFGMKRQGKTSDAWFDQFVDWLAARGLTTR